MTSTRFSAGLSRCLAAAGDGNVMLLADLLQRNVGYAVVGCDLGHRPLPDLREEFLERGADHVDLTVTRVAGCGAILANDRLLEIAALSKCPATSPVERALKFTGVAIGVGLAGLPAETVL